MMFFSNMNSYAIKDVYGGVFGGMGADSPNQEVKDKSRVNQVFA